MNDNKSIPETWQEWQQKIEADYIERSYSSSAWSVDVNTANLAEYIVQCIEDAVQADRTDRQENCEIALRKIVELFKDTEFCKVKIDEVIKATVVTLDGGE